MNEKQVKELFEQRTNELKQVKDACLKINSQIRPLEMRMNEIRSSKKQMEDYISMYPVNIAEEQSVMSQYNKLHSIAQKAEESKNILDHYLSTNEEGQKDLIDNEKIKDLKEIVRATRILYSRKKILQRSIKYLDTEKQTLNDSKEDLQRDIQEMRRWSIELEGKLALKFQKRQTKLAKVKKEAESLQELHKRKTNEYEDMKRNALKGYNDIKVLNQSILNQQNRVAQDILEIKDSVQLKNNGLMMIKQLMDAKQKLEQRYESSNRMMIAEFSINLVQKQINELKSDFEMLNEEYANSHKYCKSHLSNIKNLKDLYNDIYKIHNQKLEEKQELQNQMNEIKKINMSLDQEIKNCRNEINDKKKTLSEKKKRLDYTMIDDFQKIKGEINAVQNKAQSNIKTLEDENKIIDVLSKEAEVSHNIVESIQANKNSTPNNDEVAKFQELCSHLKYSFAELLEKKIGENREIDSQFVEDSKILDKYFYEIKRTMSPDEAFNTQADKITDDNIENDEHGPIEIMDLKNDHLIFAEDEGKYYVEKGTHKELIKLLFNPIIYQAAYRNQLLFAWHNSNISLSLLIDILVKCIDELNDEAMHEDNVDTILSFVIAWINQYPLDFVSESCQQLVNEIIGKLFSHSYILKSKSKDVESIKYKLKKLSSQTVEQFNDEYNQKMVNKINKTILSSNNLDHISIKDFPLMYEKDPLKIAYHLMYTEIVLYRKIKKTELIKCAWSKNTKLINSPNMCILTDKFNNLAKIVSYSILCQKDLKTRKRVLDTWINVMEAAAKIHDFFQIFFIVASLSNPSIVRLRKTWDLIKPERVAKFEELSLLSAPFHSYALYKKTLMKLDVKLALPYAGPWLTQMTFLEDGNPSKCTFPTNDGDAFGEEGICFKKHRYYYKALQFVQQPWGADIKFELEENLLKFCETYVVDPAIAKDAIFSKISHSLED